MKALVLVDYENEWIDPHSEYFVGDISKTIDKVNTLIIWARENAYKIIFTLHEEIGASDAFVPNSSNTQLIPTIVKRASDIVITKNKISPFYKTDLETLLQGIEEIVVAGILTNLCVRSLVSDAYDRDYSITVVKDCCVSYDENAQEFTFNDLKTTRPEVQFVNLDEIVS
jgi:nicotinamidase-related amidase